MTISCLTYTQHVINKSRNTVNVNRKRVKGRLSINTMAASFIVASDIFIQIYNS